MERTSKLPVSFFCVVLSALSIWTQSTSGAAHKVAQNQPQQTQTAASVLKNQDVLDMLKSALPPEIVVAKIKISACDFDTSPAALETLKKAGVPDDVILAMVQAPAVHTAPIKEDSNRPSLKATAASEDAGTPEKIVPEQEARQGEPGTCKIHFSVVLEDDAIPGGFGLGMDKYQRGWYVSEATKKYPGICYVADPRDVRVRYLLLYSAGERVTPPAQTVYYTEPSTGGNFASGLMQGYTDTMERTAQRRKVAYLSVFHLTTAPSGKRSLDPAVAVYSAERTSMSGLITRALSHPTKGVLEDGVRFLATLPAGRSAPPEGAAQTPAAASSESLGTISVVSSPNGAEIYVDDAFVGNTPATLKLRGGKHYVRMFMKDYKNWSRQITVQAGSEVHLTATMEKAN